MVTTTGVYNTESFLSKSTIFVFKVTERDAHYIVLRSNSYKVGTTSTCIKNTQYYDNAIPITNGQFDGITKENIYERYPELFI